MMVPIIIHSGSEVSLCPSWKPLISVLVLGKYVTENLLHAY